MQVHLVDGTYELFRHYYAVPSRADREGQDVGALLGVLGSILAMLGDDVTHVGVATDHVVESFRNDLWDGYKTGEGMDPALWAQFHPLEDGLRAMGVVVWATEDVEADDALAAAAHRAAENPAVERVVICTADKDLGQCVVGRRIVQLDRRNRVVRDEKGVIEKFGVPPGSIPDYLALVGDSSDGFPGLRGWGAKSTATVLAHYRHLEAIPDDVTEWEVSVRGAARLATSLAEQRELALLFKDLATLRTDVEVFDDVDELRWKGPEPEFETLCGKWNAPELAKRAQAVARRRAEGQ